MNFLLFITGTLRTTVRGLAEDRSRSSREERQRAAAVAAAAAQEERSAGGDEVLRTGRLDQNYMMVRAQSRLQDTSRLQVSFDNTYSTFLNAYIYFGCHAI